MNTTTKIVSMSMMAAPLALVAGMASAGGLTEPVAEAAPAPVMAAPAPVMTGNDWTGFYAGAQLGYGTLDPSVATTPAEPDGAIYGVHAGYNYDLGSIVLGAEVDYDATDISFDTPASDVESVARLKARVGYDAGAFMPYFTAGYAQVTTDSDLADETDGGFAGLGLSYMFSDQIILGGEVLQHQFEDVADTADVDATTLTLRASFKF